MWLPHLADNRLGLLQFWLTKVYPVCVMMTWTSHVGHGQLWPRPTSQSAHVPDCSRVVAVYHSWEYLSGCFWLCLMHSLPPACAADLSLLLAVCVLQWGLPVVTVLDLCAL